MTDLVSPLPYLADLTAYFAEGAGKDGLHMDAQLCRSCAAGIAEVASIISSLVTLADAHGIIEQVTVPAERRRTPTERRILAALAEPVDPDGRVVAFPIVPARVVAIAEGGSAA